MTQYPSATRRRPTLVLSLLIAFFLAGASPARVSAAAAPAAKAGKGEANVASQKKRGKGSGPTSGKRTKKIAKQRSRRPIPPPRHRHHEQRVAAMKGNQPNVQSLGALVVDLDSGHEIFARKPDMPRSIASISKLAAALVVMDQAPDLEGLTTINKVDCEVARGGAKSRLLEGLTLSNRDLLHAALLGSDNRAISALGRAAGLGTSKLTAAMNHKVATLGLRHTRFREPTGLSADNQSTPRETILLLKAAMAHPLLGQVLRRSEYDAHPVSKPPIRYVNTHRPAARGNVQVLGGKTGYNNSARYCLVLAARIGGHDYGMALLGTEGDLTRFGDVARVADWIITRKPKIAPASAPPGPPPPEVILGPPRDGGGPDAR